MAVVDLNKSYRYNIYLFDDHYEFEIEGLTTTPVRMERSDRPCTVGGYYRLWPYFSGDETAPQDIFTYMCERYDVPDYQKDR